MTAPSLSDPRPQAFVRDGAGGGWLHFTRLRRVVAARRLDEVLPVLRAVEAAVAGERLHAAGFVSYEAAPACDASLPAKSDPDFPLVWFGLFDPPVPVADAPAPAAATLPPLAWQATVTEPEYRRALGAIRNYIRNGDTYQVNFTYRLRAPLSVDPAEWFAQLAAGHAMPYAAFIDTGDWVLCSASPELFFRLDGERIESRPMKGTAARGLWAEDDLQQAATLRASEKDQAENVMIVDMVRNDLGRIADPGSVRVTTLFDAEAYPTVWQLTSTVAATTRAPLDRLFQALFPPASITGAPKRRTMQIIAELESTPRRVYTGAIGILAPGRRAQFNVAIRTLLLDRAGGQAEYGVGGGIVWDSEPEREWAECAIKTRVLHVRRPAFELLETLLWMPGEEYALLPYHLARLARSAAYFGFTHAAERVRAELDRLAAGLPPGPQRVRLLVSRTGAARAEAAPLAPDFRRFADVTLARAPVDTASVFLYHKTTERGVYAGAVGACPGFTDVLLFNARGELTESTLANVVVEIDGVRCTPPVACGLLPGTGRAALLEGQAVRERVITVDEARRSPAVYLVNAVRGLQQVRVVWPEERTTREEQI